MSRMCCTMTPALWTKDNKSTLLSFDEEDAAGIAVATEAAERPRVDLPLFLSTVETGFDSSMTTEAPVVTAASAAWLSSKKMTSNNFFT